MQGMCCSLPDLVFVFILFVSLAHFLNWRSHSRFSMMGTYALKLIATDKHTSISTFMITTEILWRRKISPQLFSAHLTSKILTSESEKMLLPYSVKILKTWAMCEITGNKIFVFWFECDQLVENYDYNHHEPFPTQWPRLLIQQSGVGKMEGTQGLCAAGYKCCWMNLYHL